MNRFTIAAIALHSSLIFASADAQGMGGPRSDRPSHCASPELAKLVASDAWYGDLFGISVALDGDTTVIGASSDSHGGGDYAGSA